MKTPHQLAITETEHALTVTNDLTIGQIIQRIADSPDASSKMDVLERMFALQERQELRQAEKDFNAAFVALQQEIPEIVAQSVVPNRGKYERFEDLAHVVNPLLVKHGFSISFAMESKDGKITETCHLKHIGGHSQSNSFSVRVGKADTETQADTKAATTAKRMAFSNCLNLIVRQNALEDEDASLIGEPIQFDQVQYLKELVKETGSDEAAFLKYADAKSYEQIGSANYDRLRGALEKKKRDGR